ncbi:restriction endonuclease subunit S [Helicobacter pylori]|nr:restriction endonuclease subunit S [Helicobacter pylori]
MDALMLPLNWQRVRLGDIFFITAGGDLSKPHYSNTKQSDFNYPIYSNAIEKKGLYGYSSFFIIKNKSITITSRGTIGVAFFRDYPYVPIGRLLVLQPKISNIDCRFYTEYINSKVKFNTEQTTIPQLTIPKVALCEIPLSPLNEQIAIANILSDLDHYLYSLDALILKKESVKKALSFELLSQRKRLKGFNQNWQKVRLGTYKYRRGSFPQPYGNPQWYSDNGMPFVQVYDVGENFKLNQKTKQKISKIAQPMSVFVPKNSVIITLQGTIGRVALTQYDCYCDRTILIFDNNTLNDVNKYFFVLSLFTKFEEEKRKADGSIIKTITKQTLKDFEILLPPLNEQIAIANILSGLDHEIISLKNKKRQFENIKKALNHNLMSAKIRVLKK